MPPQFADRPTFFWSVVLLDLGLVVYNDSQSHHAGFAVTVFRPLLSLATTHTSTDSEAEHRAGITFSRTPAGLDQRRVASCNQLGQQHRRGGDLPGSASPIIIPLLVTVRASSGSATTSSNFVGAGVSQIGVPHRSALPVAGRPFCPSPCTTCVRSVQSFATPPVGY